MKKLILILAAAVMLSGCGGGGKAVEITTGEAAQKLSEGLEINNDMMIEAPKEVIDEWYDLDDSVTEFTVYVSATSATANEIAVIKSKDVETARQALEKRVNDLKTRFEDYIPAEMAKLENPVIVTKGDAVAMVIIDDADAAEKLIGEILK